MLFSIVLYLKKMGTNFISVDNIFMNKFVSVYYMFRE